MGQRRADLADRSVAVRTRVVAGRSQCTTSRGSRADWRNGRDGGCLVLLLPCTRRVAERVTVVLLVVMVVGKRSVAHQLTTAPLVHAMQKVGWEERG
jgi:hypothetical protein